MSNRTSYLIVAIIILLAALADNWSDDPRAHHQCTDTTHETCDGRCECDGIECKVN